MELHSVTGDIVEEAPSRCDMTALWLGVGFNRRSQTWQAIRARYPEMRLVPPPPEMPWRNPEGVTFEISPPDGLLRYIHVLPNRADAHGCPDLPAVGAAVGSALDVAKGLRVRKVGFIHIPVSPGGWKPTPTECEWSASAMIGALGAWEASHPKRITDVFLVDLGGDFDRFVELATRNPPPAGPNIEPPE